MTVHTAIEFHARQFTSAAEPQSGAECPLTPTQVNIVQRLANGSARKAIAFDMNRSLVTIHQHMKNAHHRAGTTTTYALIAEALRRGWIQ